MFNLDLDSQQFGNLSLDMSGPSGLRSNSLYYKFDKYVAIQKVGKSISTDKIVNYMSVWNPFPLNTAQKVFNASKTLKSLHMKYLRA